MYSKPKSTRICYEYLLRRLSLRYTPYVVKRRDSVEQSKDSRLAASGEESTIERSTSGGGGRKPHGCTTKDYVLQQEVVESFFFNFAGGGFLNRCIIVEMRGSLYNQPRYKKRGGSETDIYVSSLCTRYCTRAPHGCLPAPTVCSPDREISLSAKSCDTFKQVNINAPFDLVTNRIRAMPSKLVVERNRNAEGQFSDFIYICLTQIIAQLSTHFLGGGIIAVFF